MDFQHRAGGKTGSGGVASSSESNRDRRERLRQLALETIDINKDPYFMKNHLGSYECKLCLTLHNNEGSYLAHTQGKKHQTNLARRAAKEAKEAPAQPAPEKVKVEVKKFVKIGRPGYKGNTPRLNRPCLLSEIHVTLFMSKFKQQAYSDLYILKYVPSREIDKGETRFWTHWNRETKQFFLQFHFKMEKSLAAPPGQAPSLGVKRPPSLITGLGMHPHSDSMPPPPGGIHGMPPGAHMPPQMPPPGALPPHMRPPLPRDL
uniref:Splicing factor 3a, subunit 2 n=1 Tax=Cyprinus carpio TaxID=7962 RepID=A0A8C2HNH1_CYPCA